MKNRADSVEMNRHTDKKRPGNDRPQCILLEAPRQKIDQETAKRVGREIDNLIPERVPAEEREQDKPTEARDRSICVRRFRLEERLCEVGLAQGAQKGDGVAAKVIRCGLVIKQQHEDNKPQENDEMQPSTRMLLTCSIHQCLLPARAECMLEESSRSSLSSPGHSCGEIGDSRNGI